MAVPSEKVLNAEVKTHVEQIATLTTQKPHNIERRAAFDIGSGQIKMQVSDVDLKTNKIINTLLTDFATVGLRENIAKSLDGKLSADIQNKTVIAISELMKKAAPFRPQSYHGVATEGLRMAKNSDDLIKRIKNETGLSVTIISQEEEGILGFISAVSEANIELDKAISWDLGGGSSQITTKHNDHYVVYQGRLGKVPTKNVLLKIQRKDVSKGESPNPISQSDMNEAIQFIQENIREIPHELCQKLNNPGAIVLGIGINPLWGMSQSGRFDRQRILEELKSRLNLDDEAIAEKDAIQKEYATYRASNLILAYGMMKALNIDQVQYVGTPGANAIGLLLSPQYWETNKIQQHK